MRLALLVAGLLLGTTGCYEQNTRVVVYPDGSGRIVVTRYFTPTAVRLIEAQAAGAGGMAASVRTEDMFFSEKALRSDAKRLFGKGVRFVSAQRLDHNGGRGSVSLYAFDKIGGVALQPSQLFQSATQHMQDSGDDSEEEANAAPDEDPDATETADTPDEDGGDEPAPPRWRHSSGDAYRFVFKSGAQPRLIVRVPRGLRPATKDEKAAAEADEESSDEAVSSEDEEEFPEEARQQMMANGNPLQLTGNETAQEIAMRMWKGLRFSIDVEVRGTPVTLAATIPDARQAGRCTLLRIDAGEMLKKSGGKNMREIERSMYGNIGTMIGKPGITTENQPEVTFTLNPAASAATPKPAAP